MRMRPIVLYRPGALALLAVLTFGACGGSRSAPTPPTPSPGSVTANAYILPGAQALKNNAFGDEPVVIYRGERLRWVNLDNDTHQLVADTAAVPEFPGTGPLPHVGEQSFEINTIGTTPFHCAIHPEMTGTLIVRDR